MPICGEDDRLKGMLTDRDIVIKVIAAGKDPAGTGRSCLRRPVEADTAADPPRQRWRPAMIILRRRHAPAV
jgi:hypothetical protein